MRLQSLRTWTTIGAPVGHVAAVSGSGESVPETSPAIIATSKWTNWAIRITCTCGWSTRVSSPADARRAHVAHTMLVAMIGGGK